MGYVLEFIHEIKFSTNMKIIIRQFTKYMNFHSLKFVISTTSSKIDAHIGKYLMKSINPQSV